MHPTRYLRCCEPAFVKGFTKILYRAGYSEKQAALAHQAVVVAELEHKQPRLMHHTKQALHKHAEAIDVLKDVGSIAGAGAGSAAMTSGLLGLGAFGVKKKCLF